MGSGGDPLECADDPRHIQDQSMLDFSREELLGEMGEKSLHEMNEDEILEREEGAAGNTFPGLRGGGRMSYPRLSL